MITCNNAAKINHNCANKKNPQVNKKFHNPKGKNFVTCLACRERNRKLNHVNINGPIFEYTGKIRNPAGEGNYTPKWIIDLIKTGG